MSGLSRLFYQAAAAFATWRAKRLNDAGERWLARAERWAKKAALATTSPEKLS